MIIYILTNFDFLSLVLTNTHLGESRILYDDEFIKDANIIFLLVHHNFEEQMFSL